MKGKWSQKNIGANTQGGFLDLIIGIIVALLIMKYLGLTVSDVVQWFRDFFGSVLR